jgi:hypothetical protein
MALLAYLPAKVLEKESTFETMSSMEFFLFTVTPISLKKFKLVSLALRSFPSRVAFLFKLSPGSSSSLF